jgi:hypothetical protein
MSCKHFRMEIEETDRATPLGARAAAHVAVCAACREFSAGRESLRRLVGGLNRVEAPADFEFRLRARIARAEGARGAGFARRGFVPGAAWLAVAACAVLALGMFVHLRQAPGQAPSAQPGGQTASEVATVTEKRSAPLAANTAEASQSVVESQAITGTAVRAAAPSQKNGSRRARFVLSPEAVQQLAVNQRGEDSLDTNNLSVQGTKIYVGSPIPLPVTTPDRPLEALFKDVHGASRVVSVDPVTFGARSLPSRRTSARTVSYNQGVW